MFIVMDFIIEFAGDLLNGFLAIGILIVIPLSLHEQNMEALSILEYENDYLCSQSRMTVGYSEYGGHIEKTLYVFCNGEKGLRHNFMRGSDEEKKYSEPLLYTLWEADSDKNWAYIHAFSVC